MKYQVVQILETGEEVVAHEATDDDAAHRAVATQGTVAAHGHRPADRAVDVAAIHMRVADDHLRRRRRRPGHNDPRRLTRRCTSIARPTGNQN